MGQNLLLSQNTVDITQNFEHIKLKHNKRIVLSLQLNKSRKF